MKKTATNIRRIVGSRRFAVILLLVLVILLAVGSAMPDLRTMSEPQVKHFARESPALFKIVQSLQIGAITSNPFFFLWPLLLFVSVLTCTASRIRPFLAGSARISEAAAAEMDAGEKAGAVFEKARALLSKRGWKPAVIKQDERPALIGRKGRSGFWGSIVFHLGMLAVVVCVLASLWTSFRGTLLISEGQTVDLSGMFNYLSYYSNPFLLFHFPEGRITLQKFNADFNDEGEAVGFDLLMTVTGPDYETRTEHLEVNRPVRVGDLSLTFRKYGFSPYFQVWGPKGRMLLDSNVRLNVFTPEETDSFTILSLTHSRVYVRFFPDLVEKNGTASTKTMKPSNPAFIVWFEDGGPKALLKYGDTVDLAGYKIKFAGLGFWAYLDASRDPAMPWMIGGFLILAAGLVWRFISHERRIIITVTDGDVSVTGSSSYFPALFEDELNRMRAELSGGGD